MAEASKSADAKESVENPRLNPHLPRISLFKYAPDPTDLHKALGPIVKEDDCDVRRGEPRRS